MYNQSDQHLRNHAGIPIVNNAVHDQPQLQQRRDLQLISGFEHASQGLLPAVVANNMFGSTSASNQLGQDAFLGVLSHFFFVQI